MKLIFVQDVPNLAKAGEIKEVADGYGRNFLIPKKLALLASPSAISMVERRIRAENQAQNEAELVELAHQIDGVEVILKARAGAKDKIYGSITSADIASELQNTTGLVIDKRKIELAEPIRQLGSYEVAIRLAKEIIPKIKVGVVEKEKKEKKEKEKKGKEKVKGEAKGREKEKGEKEEAKEEKGKGKEKKKKEKEKEKEEEKD